MKQTQERAAEAGTMLFLLGFTFNCMLDVDWSSDHDYCIDCNNPIDTLQHKDNVPKSFPLQQFDPRQYANMAREGLGYLVTCNDVR